MAKTKTKRLTDAEKEALNIYYKPSYVGQNIKNIRVLRNISINTMSEKTLLSSSRLRRIEKGANANVEEYCRIAAILDVRLDMLIFYDHRISLKDLNDEKNRFINRDYILDSFTIETMLKKREL